MPIESSLELFDEVIKLIGAVVGSFNKDAFPMLTIEMVERLRKIISKNGGVLENTPVDNILRDAIADLSITLRDYVVELSTAPNKKDFVGARKEFKEIIKQKFFNSLLPDEDNVVTPATVWKKSFNSLSKMVGVS